MAEWEEKLAHFSIIQIKNQIMKKYYSVIKRLWQWKKAKVQGMKMAIRNKKRRVFEELKKYGKSRATCKSTLKYLKK
jgi:hypothetical protein